MNIFFFFILSFSIGDGNITESEFINEWRALDLGNNDVVIFDFFTLDFDHNGMIDVHEMDTLFNYFDPDSMFYKLFFLTIKKSKLYIT